MILAPTAKRKKVINIDFCMSKFHDLLFLVPKVNNFYRKLHHGFWSFMLRELGWPVYLCSELGMTEGNAFFSNIYLSLIPNLVAFQKSSLFELKTFKSFLLQLKLIKNSMKVRRDYKWFNSSKFKQIDQCWNKFK